MSILVTGGGGSIGSAICRMLSLQRGIKIVALGHGEDSLFRLRESCGDRVRYVLGDVRDGYTVRRVIEKYEVSHVVHAAAHKHVKFCEENPMEAFDNNVIGTLSLYDACEECGVQKVVLISTDKAVKPISVLGQTKRIAEKITINRALSLRCAYTILRLVNVYDSRGNIVESFRRRAAAGDAITTYTGTVRYFIKAETAAYLAIRCLEDADTRIVIPTKCEKKTTLEILKEVAPGYDNVFSGRLPKNEKRIEEIVGRGEKFVVFGDLMSAPMQPCKINGLEKMSSKMTDAQVRKVLRQAAR